MKNKINGYSVEIVQELIDEHVSKEAYGSWSAVYSNSFASIRRTKNYPDIVSSIDVSVGGECFVVWAEWSSGDSFGTGTCSNVEPLAIFTDEVSAKVFVKILLHTKSYTKRIITPDKQEHKINCGWVGYFETLEDIHIEHAIMQ